MALEPLNLPPGVARNGTEYQVKGRWYDANLIRWFDGLMRPIGGWVRSSTATLTGKCRDMVGWTTNSGSRWLGMGTPSKLYVNGGNETLHDITPVGLTVGADDAIEQMGYGGGTYGSGLYGTARVSGAFIPPTMWMLDTWGEFLVGCSDFDGRLWEWTLATGTPAALIANAPVSCLGLIVSDERHLIALGAGGNPRKVQWSDTENNTLWTPAADNEAGAFELQTDTPIMSAVRVRGQIFIVTKSDAHVMFYVGQPFIYRRERVGAGCGSISRGSLISVEARAFWMGDNSFWTFDGSQVAPLSCDVSDFVFKNMNKVQAAKVVAGHNTKFGEVWWFYPSTNSNENDRYVIYNYREGHWTIGALGRSAWCHGDNLGFPYAIGTNNAIYRHEDTWLNDGATRVSDIFAQSGALEVGGGERVMHVSRLIPDEGSAGEVTLSFKTRYTPEGQEYTAGPYTVRGDGYTDARFSGRQASMLVKPTVDDDFRLGTVRADIVLRGKR